MPDIQLPPPTAPDIYSFGMDRTLTRPIQQTSGFSQAQVDTMASDLDGGLGDYNFGTTDPLTWAKMKLPGGWIPISDQLTYASADSPTFTATTSGDLTQTVGVGMRLKLFQTTYKYFIITAIAFASGTTTITMYGGTDYTLANAGISSVSYSMWKAPLGFPLDPTKWTVLVTDSTSRSQATMTNATWYNVGTTNSQITIPIGSWIVSYQAFIEWLVSGVGAGDVGNQALVTLSTANNSQSDADFTCSNSQVAYTALGTAAWSDTFFRQKNLTLASKTLYYLNLEHKGGGTPTMTLINADSPLIIRATSAYL